MVSEACFIVPPPSGRFANGRRDGVRREQRPSNARPLASYAEIPSGGSLASRHANAHPNAPLGGRARDDVRRCGYEARGNTEASYVRPARAMMTAMGPLAGVRVLELEA